MPHGVLGMVLIVIAVENTLAKHSDLITDLMPATWKYSATKAHKDARSAQILCFGSSLVKFGILPKVLQEETGLPAYNLSVYGGRMASSYILLKKSLESGARPKAIVLDCHDGPVSLDKLEEQSEALTTNRDNWPRLVTLAETIDVASQARDPEFLARSLMAKLLTSLESRAEIRSTVVKSLAGERIEMNPNIVAAIRNWNVNLGTQLMAPSDAPPAAAAEELDDPKNDVLKAGDFRDNPLLNASFAKLLKLASAHGIQIFLLLPPLSPGVHIGQDAQGYTVFYNDFCKKALDLDPTLVIVDGRRSGYGWPEFHDKTHLNAEGALTFSHDVGKIIATRLGASSESRWVKLPRYRKSNGNENIETFESSRVAVGLFHTVKK